MKTPHKHPDLHPVLHPVLRQVLHWALHPTLYRPLRGAQAVLATLAVALGLQAPAAAQAPLPPAQPPAAMKLHAISSGDISSRAALAYQGGDFSEHRRFSVGAILVQHPGGNLLFDAGFGEHVDEHVKTTPLLLQWLTRYTKGIPVGQQLAAAGIPPAALKAVVLTHAHWDHVSGLENLPGVPVWVTRQELDFVAGGHRATALARQLGTASYTVKAFDGGPYLGFAASHDVFGDGSVVLVPAPGHTPGSLIAFIALPSGQRYALIGDLAWQSEGVDLPAEKPWLSRRVSDIDADATRSLLARMHALKAAHPALVVVPAHDARVWDQLPRLKAP